MHGLIRVAFVADRGRQQPKQLAPLGSLVLRRALGLAQRPHVAHGGRDARPQLLEQGAIVRIALHFGREINQLAVAVVLRNRVGAAGIDAARHLAAVELSRRVPAQKLLDHVLMSQAQQRARHQGPVTNPSAPVRARPGLQRRSIALDENMRQRAADGVGDACLRLGYAQCDEVQAPPPFICGLRVLRGEPGGC